MLHNAPSSTSKGGAHKWEKEGCRGGEAGREQAFLPQNDPPPNVHVTVEKL